MCRDSCTYLYIYKDKSQLSGLPWLLRSEDASLKDETCHLILFTCLYISVNIYTQFLRLLGIIYILIWCLHIYVDMNKLTKIIVFSHIYIYIIYTGGTSRMALIMTVSPSVANSNETLSTLRFGLRAKTMQNKVCTYSYM